MQARCTITAGPVSVSVSGDRSVVELIENFFGCTYRTSRAATKHDWAIVVVTGESMPQHLEIPTTSAVEWAMEHDERGSFGASLKQILLPALDLRVESRLSERLAPDEAKREIVKHIVTDDPDHPNWLHLNRSPVSPDSQADLLCNLVPIRRLTLGHDFRTFARRLDCLGLRHVDSTPTSH